MGIVPCSVKVCGCFRNKRVFEEVTGLGRGFLSISFLLGRP